MDIPITLHSCARCGHESLAYLIKTALPRGLRSGIPEVRMYPAFHSTTLVATCDVCNLGEHMEIEYKAWRRMTEPALTQLMYELREKIASYGRDLPCAICERPALSINWNRGGVYVARCVSCGWATVVEAVANIDPLVEAVAANLAAGEAIRRLYSGE